MVGSQFDGHRRSTGNNITDVVPSGTGFRSTRDEQMHVLLVGVISDVFQHGKGFWIGPMQVLDDQDDRTVAVDRGQQPEHALAQHHRRLDGPRSIRVMPLGMPSAARYGAGVGVSGGPFRRHAAAIASASGR
jgi:hypothetical protein